MRRCPLDCSKDQTPFHIPAQNPILPLHKSPYTPFLTFNSIAIEIQELCGVRSWQPSLRSATLTNPIGIPCFYWLKGFLDWVSSVSVYAGLSCCCSQWRFVSTKIRPQGARLYARLFSFN